MTRKPNFAKFMLGLVVLASLFIGTWATTRGDLTSAKKGTLSTAKTAAVRSNTALPNAGPLAATPLDSLTSVLELDGDIQDNPLGLPDDWDSLNCGGGTTTIKAFEHDGLNTTIFTGGGSKDPENLGSWKHKNGSVPDKDEIINAYAAKYTGTTGDDILAFGADRYDNSGTAFIGFWFFQSPVFAAADGKFRTGPAETDPLAEHVVGDILILIEFTIGGSFATAKVFEWVGTGGSESGGTLNDITGTAPAGSVFSISNSTAQTVPGTCTAWEYTPKGGAPGGPIPTNAFFEGAINLDAFPGLGDVCFSSFMTETRSSASVTATLKDFVLDQLDTCPEISVTKVARDDDVCAGDPVTYDYTVTNPTGFNLSVTLVDDNETAGTGDDLDVGADGNCAAIVGSPTSFTLNAGASRTFTCTRTLSVGTHTNIVTAVATFGSFSDDATATETVTVNASPALSINQITCDLDGSSTLTVTDGNTTGATYSWTRNGAAFAGNVTSINVTQTGTYVVTGTTAAGCIGTATRVVGLCSD